MTTVMITMMRNNTFASKFIYKSRIPTLVLGVLAPSATLVSFPMYITNPTICPFVRTVEVHTVFSRVNFYLKEDSSTFDSVKSPSKL